MSRLKTQLSVTNKGARNVRDRLSEPVIRDEQSGTVTRRLPDGQGLDLLIHPDGRKWWRFKYRLGSNAKCLLFGDYPGVSLEAARQHRDKARNLLAAGIDPIAGEVQKRLFWRYTGERNRSAVLGRDLRF